MELNFVLSSHVKENGQARIKLQVYHKGDRKYISTDHSVLPSEWESNKQRVGSKHINHLYINKELGELADRWQRALIEHGDMPLKFVADFVDKGEAAFLLVDFIKAYRKECEGIKAKGTTNYYKYLQEHIENFEKKAGRVYMNKINKGFYDQFKGYLTNELKHNTNTCSKYLSTVKIILNEARRRGYEVSPSINDGWWKAPRIETDKIFLTAEEIDKIIKTDWAVHKHLQDEVKRFLVAYYFLLRFGDSISFDKTNFVQEKGMWYFVKLTQKTKHTVKIPVKPFIMEILKESDFKLGKDANPEANWKLKEIGRIAGIDDDIYIDGKMVKKYTQITTHTARRSGATNLILANVNQKIVMFLGGWKTERSFKSYIRMGDEDVASVAANLDFYK